MSKIGYGEDFDDIARSDLRLMWGKYYLFFTKIFN